MNSWARLYGKVYALWCGPTLPLLVVYHPDTTRAILSSNEPKDEQFYSFFRPWIGDGLLVSRGDKWARNRRLLTKAFHFQVLQPYIEVFSESTNILLNKWNRLNGEHTTVELHGDISLLTLDSLTKCTFGINTDCQNTKLVTKYEHKPRIDQPGGWPSSVATIERFFYHRTSSPNLTLASTSYRTMTAFADDSG
ncbi:Cytochrome P450 4F11 [Lamellibrachia satsuma]|nr:Cytochrome P450 4F11 [Lamellibrachia satsuma]